MDKRSELAKALEHEAYVRERMRTERVETPEPDHNKYRGVHTGENLKVDKTNPYEDVKVGRFTTPIIEIIRRIF